MDEHAVKTNRMPIKIDTKEFELPETIYIRDIENQVFQSIVFQCLKNIEGICLVEGNFIDNLLGRGTVESARSIYIEQDNKTSFVTVKVEVNCVHGVSIPDKAEEIQHKIAKEITKITGLHVASVHVVFKNVLNKENLQQMKNSAQYPQTATKFSRNAVDADEEYTDEF